VICHFCGRPRLLDAYSGEGGAGEGYRRAGFCVTAVDNNQARLDNYWAADCPGAERICGDAIMFILAHGPEYAAVHTSPTCTGYSQGTVAILDRVARYDRLIAATREALVIANRPYVIENVYGARRELHTPALLCGRMFGLSTVDTDGTKLTLDRHRMFETNWLYLPPEHDPHGWVTNRRQGLQVAGAYSGARRDKREAREERKGGYVPKDVNVLRELLGTPWMTEKGCQLSIPPVYAEHIGTQLVEVVSEAAA
jgi:DNA (cytosine-5)-methyltransferase 1